MWHCIDNGCISNFVPIFLHHAILHHWHRWSCPMLTLPAAAAPRRVTAIISHHCHCVAVIWNNVSVSSAAADPEAIHVASGGLAELPSGPLSTKTVLGFLDFTTTVSDTVIKFTSQGGPLFFYFLKRHCITFYCNCIDLQNIWRMHPLVSPLLVESLLVSACNVDRFFKCVRKPYKYALLIRKRHY